MPAVCLFMQILNGIIFFYNFSSETEEGKSIENRYPIAKLDLPEEFGEKWAQKMGRIS